MDHTQAEPLPSLHLDELTQTGSPEQGATSPDENTTLAQALPQTLEQEEQADPFEGLFATPFQMSTPLSPVKPQSALDAAPGPPPEIPVHKNRKRSTGSFPVIRATILIVMIIATIIAGALVVFVQPPTVPTQTSATHHPSGPSTPGAPPNAPRQSQTPSARTASPQPTPSARTWLPAMLPQGWTAAGLSQGDALFAERTAISFTDREMSLDYRSVGTREQHGGTFTVSSFLLTPNAKVRFVQNDVRMFDNTFFDTVQQEQRIQSVVDAQPHLVNFAQQGQQQFAWVDISFLLWQSKQINGTRTERFDLDQAGHPRLHHMQVLLLRVPPSSQGVNPAMGGTGWLVSTYELDLAPGTALEVIEPA